MIFYGGYEKMIISSEIFRINLDTFEYQVQDTSYTPSYFHSTSIWNDFLLIFGGECLDKELIMHNLIENQGEIYPISFQKYQNPRSCSHFILNDVLYFTSSFHYIITFDLIKKNFSNLEKKYPFFSQGSSMLYYDGIIYYFGGNLSKHCSNMFRINLKTLEYDSKEFIEIYGHSAFIYDKEFIICGGQLKEGFNDLLKFNLFESRLGNKIQKIKNDLYIHFE